MAIEVIKLKKGTLYRAVFSKNRKRISKCFNRKFDAESWLRQQEELHRFGFKKQITLSEAAEIWLENHSHVRKSPGAHTLDRLFGRFADG